MQAVALEIMTQPQDATVINGQTASTTVTATGDRLTCQWYVKNRSATKCSKGSVTKNTYNATMSDAVDGRQVYCVVSDAYGNTITSNTATLSKYVLAITSKSQDATVENDAF